MSVRTQVAEARRVRLTGKAALLMIAVTVLALLATVPLREFLAQRGAITDLERRAAELQQHNGALEADINRLHDPDYLEQLARECLGMVKPGEIAFVTKHPGQPAAANC